MRENKIVFFISSILAILFFGLIFLPDTLAQTIFSSLFASMIITAIIALVNFLIQRKHELQIILREMRELRYIDNSIADIYFKMVLNKDESLLDDFVKNLTQFCLNGFRISDELGIVYQNFYSKNYKNALSIAHDCLAVKSAFYKTISDLYNDGLVGPILTIDDILKKETVFYRYIFIRQYWKILSKLVYRNRNTKQDNPIEILEITELETKIRVDFETDKIDIAKTANERLEKEKCNPHFNIFERYKVTDKFIRKYNIDKKWFKI